MPVMKLVGRSPRFSVVCAETRGNTEGGANKTLLMRNHKLPTFHVVFADFFAIQKFFRLYK